MKFKTILAALVLTMMSTYAYAEDVCYHFNGSSMVAGPCDTTVTPTPTPTPTPVPTPAPSVTLAQPPAPLGELDDTWTTPGLFARSVPSLPSPADRTLFHEIVPCRLVDTRLGSGPFIQNEFRNYDFVTLPSTNDCYQKLPPAGVVALGVQVTSFNDGVQVGFITFNMPFYPNLYSTLQNTNAFLFYENVKSTFEPGTLAVSGNSIQVWNRGGVTDLTVDILGYHLNDAAAFGNKGDKGDTGLTGATGAQGEKGMNGDKGDKGDKGDQGIQGLTGETGKTGDPGAPGKNGTSCVVVGNSAINPTAWTMSCDGKLVASWHNGSDGVGTTCVTSVVSTGHYKMVCTTTLGSTSTVYWQDGEKCDDGAYPCGGYIQLCASKGNDNNNGLELPVYKDHEWKCDDKGHELVKLWVIPATCDN